MTELLQERYADDPWKMWVACILLNQTTREQVDRVIDKVFYRWPGASAMRIASLREVAQTLEDEGQGLQWVKAARLIRMSDDYITWYEKMTLLPEQIHGVGQYAVDSYEIFFCKHKDHPVPSGDKELLAYVERRKR